MHLFEKNKNVDLFNSLQLIRMQFNSGQGVQSLIKNISEKQYGVVSKKFAKIMKKADEGMELATAIGETQNKERDKYIKLLLHSFKLSIEQDIDINMAIDEVEQELLDDQKETFDNYI